MRRFSRSPWRSLGMPLAVGALLAGCRDPTEVVIEITTDVQCSDHPSTGIAVGRAGDLDIRAFSTVTTRCDADTGRIGAMVVVPGPDNPGELAIRVVGGLLRTADDCVSSGYKGGCIVARRVLGFLPHATLTLPIALEASCIDVPCEATETCRRGACVSAVIADPSACTSPRGCEVTGGGAGGISGAGGSGGRPDLAGGGGDMNAARGGNPGPTEGGIGGIASGGKGETTTAGGESAGGGGGESAGGGGGESAGGENAGGAGGGLGATGGASGAGGLGGSSGGALPIDPTEVTRSAYDAWLSTNPLSHGQPSYCSWNTDFTPSCSWPPSDSGDYPVVCVDWCDAYAYCRAVGRRLCGNLGGEAAPFNSPGDANQSQWYRACSSNGKFAYPYGDTYSETGCNTSDAGRGTAAPVGSFAACHSSEPGYEGVLDLIGNVAEWEDSCDATTGDLDVCLLRGGSFRMGGNAFTCDFPISSGRSSSLSWVGFRCCQ